MPMLAFSADFGRAEISAGAKSRANNWSPGPRHCLGGTPGSDPHLISYWTLTDPHCMAAALRFAVCSIQPCKSEFLWRVLVGGSPASPHSPQLQSLAGNCQMVFQRTPNPRFVFTNEKYQFPGPDVFFGLIRWWQSCSCDGIEEPPTLIKDGKICPKLPKDPNWPKRSLFVHMGANWRPTAEFGKKKVDQNNRNKHKMIWFSYFAGMGWHISRFVKVTNRLWEMGVFIRGG